MLVWRTSYRTTVVLVLVVPTETDCQTEKIAYAVASGIPTAVGNSEGESPPYDCTACTHVFSCCCWSSVRMRSSRSRVSEIGASTGPGVGSRESGVDGASEPRVLPSASRDKVRVSSRERRSRRRGKAPHSPRPAKERTSKLAETEHVSTPRQHGAELLV